MSVVCAWHTCIPSSSTFMALDSATGRSAHIRAAFGGTYMVYNLLAAWAVASLAGVHDESFMQMLDSYEPDNGRLQRFMVQGRNVVLNLAKNPTGLNQNMTLLMADPQLKAVYVVVNDNFNDGRDVSWIWDVDFERLTHPDIVCVIAGGSRANDVQVRFKYAGMSSSTTSSVRGALDLLASAGIGSDCSLYVLANYSALWPAKEELERMEARHE